jgi:SAM-dependent methyltransferase
MRSSRLERHIGASIFGTDVQGYESGRIGYPDGLYDAIAAYASRPTRILEIGPGTGLATKALLDRLNPDKLVAVEADAAMADHLRAALPTERLEVIVSGFETAQLNAAFDLVVCAAAFHWLEPESTLARIRELLVPGGTFALWWNAYRQPSVGDAFADAVVPLLAGIDLAPSEASGGHYSLDIELHRKTLLQAGFTHFETHHFRRNRVIGIEEVLALYASYSYIRALPEADRLDVLHAIAGLAKREFDGAVPNVVLSQLYLASAPTG